jgi:hypothetical protein
MDASNDVFAMWAESGVPALQRLARKHRPQYSQPTNSIFAMFSASGIPALQRLADSDYRSKRQRLDDEVDEELDVQFDEHDDEQQTHFFFLIMAAALCSTHTQRRERATLAVR